MPDIDPEDLFRVPELDDDCDLHGDGVPVDAEDQEGEDHVE